MDSRRPTLRDQPIGALPEYPLDTKDAGPTQANDKVRPTVSKRNSSILGRMFSTKTPEEWMEKNDELMFQRWGSSDSLTYQMVLRYWTAQRIEQHWRDLYKQYPKQFAKYLAKGYMEPIPTEASLTCFFKFVN